jgi:hypothetical protein
MDDKQFDSLTRQVGQQANRRTMVKTALGGTLALLGVGGLAGQSDARNNRNNRRTGYEDDPCAANDDCLQGLTCKGARQGIAPGFPTPIDVPVITGKEGTCEYKKACGGEQGDACRRNDDCCDDLTCDNNRCRRN